MPNDPELKAVLESRAFLGRKRLREHAAEQAQGARWAEFGVREGRSAKHFLSLLRHHGELHLFDSWQGLPEDWVRDEFSVTEAGHFACEPPKFDDDRVKIHRGWFKDTLADPMGPVYLYHLDCDLYSSTIDVLEARVADTARPGTLILFDDLFGYARWREGQWRAMREFCEKYGVYGRWLGHTPKGQALWRTHGTG